MSRYRSRRSDVGRWWTLRQSNSVVLRRYFRILITARCTRLDDGANGGSTSPHFQPWKMETTFNVLFTAGNSDEENFIVKVTNKVTSINYCSIIENNYNMENSRENKYEKRINCNSYE